MTFDEVDEMISSHKEDFLEQLFTFIRQKSISTENEGMTECADLLKAYMEEIGIETKIMQTEGHPIVYGEMVRDKHSFTLLIYGHYDVQPADPLDQWVSPPFDPTIRDGRVYGRGTGDNKGQLMAQLLGIKIYKEVFGDLPINLKFVFEGEEEKGSVNLPRFVSDNQELLKADLVYTADGSSHYSGSPLILLGARGMLSIEITVKGAEWDNHSGNTGNIVPNPAWKLIDLLHSMKDENGDVLIEGFYDYIRSPSEKEMELLRQLPFDQKKIGSKIGYSGLTMDGESYYRKLTMEPTFNIFGMESGYTGGGVKTIIPATASAKMDIRLVADQDPSYVYDRISDYIKEYDPDMEVEFLGSMKPSRTSADMKIVDVVTNAVHQAYNTKPLIQPSLSGSLPDYVWTSILQTPSIIMPYANFDQRNHSPNENIKLDSFFGGIKCTCTLIERLGEYDKSFEK